MGVGIAHQHGQAERQVGDVGERPAGRHSERRERREDRLLEVLGELGAPLLVELVDADQADLVRRELGSQLPFEAVGQASAQREHALADQRDRLRGDAPVLSGGLHSSVDLLAQAGDAHHVELVEIGRVDRAELRPLDQRDAVVLRQLEHAVIEVKP